MLFCKWLLLCHLFSQYSALLSHSTLYKQTIRHAETIGAVCNDFTPAVYYLHRNNNTTDNNWIIFLEGGGGCATLRECEERYKRNSNLMSSKHFPASTESRSLLSSSVYKDFTKVIIPHCSSDSWLGESRILTKDQRNLTSENIMEMFTFRGYAILKAVTNELLNYGLDEADHVVLSGSSAGGIGITNYIAPFKEMLTTAKISVIVDSSWFINFQNYFESQSSAVFLTNSGIINQSACRDVSHGIPCCFSMSCMLSKSYIPKSVPLLVMFSRYDAYILFNDLIKSESINSKSKTLKNKDLLLSVKAFGGQMLQSLEMVKSVPLFSYVFASCFQHGFIKSSTLWGDVYKEKVELYFESVHFEHTIYESNWLDFYVREKNLNSYVNDWQREILNGNFTYQIQISDSCSHAQCNPTCPKLIYFNSYISGWSSWKRTVLLFIVIFIFASCLLIKIVWIMKHRQLRKTQSLYLCTNYEEDDLDKIMCLPTCPPHSSIGISCSMLQYDIMIPGQPLVGTLKRNQKQAENTQDKGQKPQRKISIGNMRRRNMFATPGKQIIKGVTAYFNPGQLVAIMGPSGAGKTTLLDILTARKELKQADANIYINGLPSEEVRDWFIKNSGYVLQLATPYHEELTVRQNLTYNAMMRLPMKMKIEDKMWRVEQVLGQCGLYDVADVVVGDNTPNGGGLSGGQKRRLCIALQLLDLPSVIFLDEPTSGLDSASSLELLETLHGLTLSGRLVVVTIHQPRIEIFHMFDSILILCDGQTAYFGSPIVAPMMIAEALQGSGKVFDSSNPADTIMDVLTNRDSQKAIVDYYQSSGEIEAINRAIQRAKRHPQKTLSMKFQKQTSSIQNRLLALDGRSSASQTFSQRLYFPVVFLLYSLSLGTCYWKTNEGVLLMSCYMVFSCASQLFMSSVIHAHLNKAFALFSLEKSDGVGHSHELVLHVFVRVFSQSSLPLICACAIIYFCTIHEYIWWKFALTTLLHLQLNQTWIALITFVACLTPRYSPLVSPLLSAIAGFAGGFLVPEPQMPIFYYWLFYVNPTHWGYAGMAKVLLADIKFKCQWNSPLDCQNAEGIVVLEQFGLHESNPYASMAVLLFMLFLLLILSVVVLELKYSKLKWRKFKEEHWQSFKLKFSYFLCCCFAILEYRKRKKLEKETEKARLFKLAEEEYRYKGETGNAESNQQQNSYIIPLTRNDSKKSFTDAETIDSYNSSNDEDDELDQAETRLKTDLQKRSTLSVIMKKIHSSVSSGLSSKGRSNNESIILEPTIEERPSSVTFRTKNKKNKKWKQLLTNRRKTFTGGIEEDDITDTLLVNRRPKSLMLPKNNEKYSPDIKLPFLLSTSKSEDQNVFGVLVEENAENNKQLQNSETAVECQRLSASIPLNEIETAFINASADEPIHVAQHLAPPDIVIDIERLSDYQKKPEEDGRTEDSVFSSGGDKKQIQKTKRRKRRHKKDRKSKEVWSNYLDTTQRRHEVYCALNSVKKRLRGKERAKDIARAVKKNSLSLQRKQSMQLLENKRRSLRDQLTGLHSSFNASDYSAATRKRLELLRARNKFRKSTQESESDAATKKDEEKTKTRPLSDSTNSVMSSKRNSKQEDVKISNSKELLERLNTALNSQRNSRSITAIRNSLNSLHENDNFAISDSDNEPNVSNELIDVIKKLNSLEGFTDRRRAGSCLSEAKYRDSDPLLPKERQLIEHLLHKYNSSQTTTLSGITARSESDHKPIDEKFSYSSKVKIRASPGHSRTASIDFTKPGTHFRQSVHTSDLAAEKITEDTENNIGSTDSNLNNDTTPENIYKKKQSVETSIRYEKDISVNEEQIDVLKVDTKRKLNLCSNSSSSDYESDACSIEGSNDSGDDETDDGDRIKNSSNCEVNNKRDSFRSKSSRDEERNSSASASSDYDDVIMKTHEGFIIPKEALSKVIGSDMSPLTFGMKLRRDSRTQEEEIERQFKRENFLKDRPTRKGVRMPLGSTGKVNLLKSKFESGLGKSGNAKIRRSLEKLNQKGSEGETTRTQRHFFRKIKTSKNSNSFDENSEDEREEIILAARKMQFSK